MEFLEFKKIPRLFRECVITEKIDGTNGQIVIKDSLDGQPNDTEPLTAVETAEALFYVYAGSRNRWVYATKDKDNSGFAAWVLERAKDLVEILGPGRHFGEFWGAGIQRKYGLKGDDKRFSLFHPKWNEVLAERVVAGLPYPKGLTTVPVLYQGEFDTDVVDRMISDLANNGSYAEPGFMDPEGVVIYHEAAKQYFKVTVKGDDKPKGSTE